MKHHLQHLSPMKTFQLDDPRQLAVGFAVVGFACFSAALCFAMLGLVSAWSMTIMRLPALFFTIAGGLCVLWAAVVALVAVFSGEI